MDGIKCEVAENRLVASGDFRNDSDTSFDTACQKLLGTKEKELVADLAAVGYLASTYVGLLAETCLKAQQTGKKMVIRAGPRLVSMLKEAGLDRVAQIEESGKGEMP